MQLRSPEAVRPTSSCAVRKSLPVAFSIAALAAATSAQALNIIPVYDSSITSLSNATAIEAAFQNVANQFNASFASPVTVKIGVSWGKVASQTLGTGNISASVSPLRAPYAYSDIVAAFAATAAANPNDPYLASVMQTLPAKSPAGALSFDLPYAQAQALGLLSATIPLNSGYVGFSSTVNWDLSSANGVSAGMFDFQGLAAHEISEVLGRVTGLQKATPAFATLFDALRYAAPGVSSFSYSAPAYFSIDGGVTNLGAFNYSGTGDRSDWNAIAGDAQSAVLKTGTALSLSTSDMIALDVLGWGAWTPLISGSKIGAMVSADDPTLVSFGAVPEPATWSMLLLGVGLVGGMARRRRELAPA